MRAHKANFLIAFIFLLWIISLIASGYKDKHEQSPVPQPEPVNCPYEGLECPNGKKYARDYQIELHMDTVRVYDGERLVGSYISTWENQIDSIITWDNQ